MTAPNNLLETFPSKVSRDGLPESHRSIGSEGEVRIGVSRGLGEKHTYLITQRTHKLSQEKLL